jgi:hypothetical protein
MCITLRRFSNGWRDSPLEDGLSRISIDTKKKSLHPHIVDDKTIIVELYFFRTLEAFRNRTLILLKIGVRSCLRLAGAAIGGISVATGKMSRVPVFAPCRRTCDSLPDAAPTFR